MCAGVEIDDSIWSRGVAAIVELLPGIQWQDTGAGNLPEGVVKRHGAGRSSVSRSAGYIGAKISEGAELTAGKVQLLAL